VSKINLLDALEASGGKGAALATVVGVPGSLYWRLGNEPENNGQAGS